MRLADKAQKNVYQGCTVRSIIISRSQILEDAETTVPQLNKKLVELLISIEMTLVSSRTSSQAHQNTNNPTVNYVYVDYMYGQQSQAQSTHHAPLET